MRKSKAASVAFAAGLLATLLLSGCGGASSTSGIDTSKVSGTITFQTWSLKNAKFTPYFNNVISTFEAAHPGTTINWIDQPGDGYTQKIASQVSSNTLPDVVNLPPDIAYPVAKTGNLLDLSKNVPNLTTEWVKSGVDAYSYAGIKGDFGFPWYLGTDVNYWNKAMMAKDGLDATHPPTTFADLVAQAKIMHDNSGGKDYLMSRAPGLSDIVNSGTSLLSPDGKKFAFNTPAAEAMLDKYTNAFQSGYMPSNVLNNTYEGNSKLFVEQRVAWTTGSGNYITSVAQDNPTLAANIVPGPALDHPPLYVQGISVSAKSKNLGLALAFAQYVTNNDNQVAFIQLAKGFLPGSAASANDPAYSKSDGTPQGDAAVLAYKNLQTAINFTPPVWTDAMNTILNQEIAKAMTKHETSKQALDNAVDQCNALLSE